jgi:D-3-phosphoglycerate dehydrogenase
MTGVRDGIGRPYAFWSERQVPSSARSVLDQRAILIGSSDTEPDDPLASIGDAVAIIASARITYDAALMDRAPSLRVISRTGTGTDNIDVAEATARGIVVCNVPDGPTTSTAEHTLALLLAVAKRLKSAEAVLADGRFDVFNEHDALELHGRVLGLVGIGSIGRLVARYGRAFGMSVIAYDPFVEDDIIQGLDVEPCPSLLDLLGRAEVVSLHAPLSSVTHHMINRATLASMRDGAILVNTARGGLIDEDALADALDAGRLRGVGIDVFDPEPPTLPSRLLGRFDVVATPHVAAATGAARARLWHTAIIQALQVLDGDVPDHVVNPAAVRA